MSIQCTEFANNSIDKFLSITLFSIRALARYCAPSTPIEFRSSRRILNVYSKKLRFWLIKTEKNKFFTSFFISASARCLAPSTWKLFCSRCNVVSVYREKFLYERTKIDWINAFYFIENQSICKIFCSIDSYRILFQS